MQSSATLQQFAGPAPTGGRLLRAAGALLLESLRRHRVLAALVIGYAISCYVVGWAAGGSAVLDVGQFAGKFALLLVAALCVPLLGSFIRARSIRGSGSLREAMRRDLAARWLSSDRLANFLAPALLGPLFIATFGSFKRLIPYVAPFSWDEEFMHWDRWLHGTDAWLLLQPLVGTPLVTSALNAVYVVWFFVALLTFIWQALSTRRSALREQFLISFVLYWIVIGTVLAMLMSSAGPCYFGSVTGLADPYTPLMEYLRAASEYVPVWAVQMQDMLWQNHQVNGTLPGSGISAMPSMHVAIAVLLALFGWHLNRWAGIVLTFFAVLIMIGSVHLGWHYAVDAYVSIVVGVAIWYGVGWIQRRTKRRPTVLVAGYVPGLAAWVRQIERKPVEALSAA